MGIIEYLRRKDIIKNTPYVIRPNGKGGYLFRGLIIPRATFLKKFALPETVDITLNKYK